MNKRFLISFFLSLIMFLLGCSQQGVTNNYVSEYSIDALRDYLISEALPPSAVNTPIEQTPGSLSPVEELKKVSASVIGKTITVFVDQSTTSNLLYCQFSKDRIALFYDPDLLGEDPIMVVLQNQNGFEQFDRFEGKVLFACFIDGNECGFCLSWINGNAKSEVKEAFVDQAIQCGVLYANADGTLIHQSCTDLLGNLDNPFLRILTRYATDLSL